MFWHAAGHGVDAERTPERLEHFGIATVEAMNSGAVPLVFGRGGPTEVVTHGRDGFLWHTPAELAEHTLALAHDEAARRRFAHEAHASSLRFGRDVFADTLEALVRDMMASPSGRSLR
jgi:glycosyltransferase involved in cell wall biosynthesis